MAALKPRTGDGPLEVAKEGRGIILRMPVDGGGRLVVEISVEEAVALSEALAGVPLGGGHKAAPGEAAKTQSPSGNTSPSGE